MTNRVWKWVCKGSIVLAILRFAARKMGDKQTIEHTETPPKAGEDIQRFQSEDSARFYEQQDEYDDFDDFAASGKPAGGAGISQKMSKRVENKGGGGSGSIYSAKHIRQKEALAKSQSTATKKS